MRRATAARRAARRPASCSPSRRPATHEVTVDYQTVYGEAGAADFIASNGEVTFAAGEQSKTITIEITPDRLVEGNEHFGVVLSNAVGATITRATGTGTIVDDDTAPTARTSATTATDPTPPRTRRRPRGHVRDRQFLVRRLQWQRHARE